MKKLRKGTEIKFKTIDDFTGKEFEVHGKIIGYASEIRKLNFTEFAELLDDENVYLVQRETVNGNQFHVVWPEEILKEVKNENQS